MELALHHLGSHLTRAAGTTWALLTLVQTNTPTPPRAS